MKKAAFIIPALILSGCQYHKKETMNTADLFKKGEPLPAEWFTEKHFYSLSFKKIKTIIFRQEVLL
jgi:hypothetical protein